MTYYLLAGTVKPDLAVLKAELNAKHLINPFPLSRARDKPFHMILLFDPYDRYLTKPAKKQLRRAKCALQYQRCRQEFPQSSAPGIPAKPASPSAPRTISHIPHPFLCTYSVAAKHRFLII